MSISPLLTTTSSGLYCPDADVYLDPWRPVARALITHGHSDHARPYMDSYVCTNESVPILKHRLGSEISISGMRYGETMVINNITFSFHPAGHVPGSAQIRVERTGEVWVFSGDYKVENDLVSTPFEPIKCHTFISECTFGLPIFKWEAQASIFKDIHTWWLNNVSTGSNSVLLAYSLGKCHRILKHLDGSISPVFIHSSILSICKAMNFSLDHLTVINEVTPKQPCLFIAPPALLGSPYLKRFNPYQVGSASGWMAVRGMKRRRNVDRGFILSDHADFPGLLSAFKETQAEKILLIHGYTAHLSRYLQENGVDASELAGEFNDAYQATEDDLTETKVET